MKEIYDVIIIGGGCSGYPCAMYSQRFNLKTLLITSLRGGLITTTHLVENWPGEVSLSGPELALKLENHAKESGAEIKDGVVTKIIKQEDSTFRVELQNGEGYISKTIVLATGTKHRHLGILSEEKFSGKGVSYCATCDGGFFRKKITAVIGGGDSSLKETMVLAGLCDKVYLFARSKLKGEPINETRIRNLKNVEVFEGEELDEILGDKKVERIKMKSGKEFEVSGVFISIGLLPQNELAKMLNVDLNKRGEIIIDKDSKTNIDGVFAAGDVTNANWKQGIVAAAEGAIAANSAFEYIQKNG